MSGPRRAEGRQRCTLPGPGSGQRIQLFGGAWLVRTGDDTFCLVGQWKTFQNIVNARPEMIRMLEERAMLEDLGGGLGVTDPVSGSAVVKLGAATRPRER